IQAIPQAKFPDGGITEPALLEIAQANGLSGGALPKGPGKIPLGKFTDKVHALPLVGKCPVLVVLLGLLYLYIVFPGQVFYGLGRGEVVVLNKKRYAVLSFSSSEILPY